MRRLLMTAIASVLAVGMLALGGMLTAASAVTIADPPVHFAATNTANLNVRLHASQNAQIIARVPENGWPLVILGQSYEGKQLWYHIATWGQPNYGDTDGVILGWVRADLVTIMSADHFMSLFAYWKPPIVRPTPRPTPKPTYVPIRPPIYVFPTPTYVPIQPPIYVFPTPTYVPIQPPIYVFPTPTYVPIQPPIYQFP